MGMSGIFNFNSFIRLQMVLNIQGIVSKHSYIMWIGNAWSEMLIKPISLLIISLTGNVLRSIPEHAIN